jgi:integrase
MRPSPTTQARACNCGRAATYLIIAARADEGAVTGVMGHANIATTRRLYAADWREAEERNVLVLRQLAEAGIGQ